MRFWIVFVVTSVVAPATLVLAAYLLSLTTANQIQRVYDIQRAEEASLMRQLRDQIEREKLRADAEDWQDRGDSGQFPR